MVGKPCVHASCLPAIMTGLLLHFLSESNGQLKHFMESSTTVAATKDLPETLAEAEAKISVTGSSNERSFKRELQEWKPGIECFRVGGVGRPQTQLGVAGSGAGKKKMYNVGGAVLARNYLECGPRRGLCSVQEHFRLQARSALTSLPKQRSKATETALIAPSDHWSPIRTLKLAAPECSPGRAFACNPLVVCNKRILWTYPALAEPYTFCSCLCSCAS